MKDEKIAEICHHFNQALLDGRYLKALLHYKISGVDVQREMFPILKDHYRKLQADSMTARLDSLRSHQHVHPHLEMLFFNIDEQRILIDEQPPAAKEVTLTPKDFPIGGLRLKWMIEEAPRGRVVTCLVCNEMLKDFVFLGGKSAITLKHLEEVSCPSCSARWVAEGYRVTLIKGGRVKLLDSIKALF